VEPIFTLTVPALPGKGLVVGGTAYAANALVSDPQGSEPSVRSQAQSSPTAAPPYRRQREYPPQTPPYPTGPGLAPGMGPAFGSGGSFLGTAASTAAGVIGGGLLLNSIRSMFGEHAGLGGHERGGLGGSGARVADLAQQDRDQDQDQDQDDDDQALADQDQDQDQDQDAGDFGEDDTDYAKTARLGLSPVRVDACAR
jgi:hypothetical protein